MIYYASTIRTRFITLAMKTLSHHWLFHKVKRSSKEAQLLRLNHLLTELVQAGNIEEILETVLTSIEASLQGDASAIYLLGEDGKSIEQTRLHGVSPSYAQQITNNYQGLPGETVLLTGKPVYIENTLKSHTYGERLHFLANYGWLAIGIFPIRVKEQALGALTVYYRKPHRITTQERQLGMTYASIVGVSLQDSRYTRRLKEYATELEQHVQVRTAELQIAKEYMEAIISSMPDATFVLEKNRQLSLANQAGQELLAQAKQEEIDIFADEWLQHLSIEQTPSEKAIIQVGERFYQALSSHLYISEQDEGLVIVYRDVTRFRELDQLKSQFVSDVSHELRTPLANLTLYLDLISNIGDPRQHESYLQVLQRETGRLTRLIEDLLTISRLEAGRMKLSIKSVEIEQVLAELAYDRNLMASGQGLKLRYNPTKSLPIIKTDSALLNQCLSNLLTNAINYTPPGGSIQLKAELSHPDSEWLLIHIIDNGVGIPPEELSEIFNRFYRGTASRQTSAPGTGLGLSISKELIERMGGKLTVKSLPGQGSTFTIWLPTHH